MAIFLVLLLSCVFSVACAPSYSNPEVVGEQDYDYVVTSNGGSAVQFGNYVYFINGYRGYDDDGNDNSWGKVVKGGLYRAELKGGQAEEGKGKQPFYYLDSFGLKVDGLNTFVSSFDAETEYNFVTDKRENVLVGFRKDDDGNIMYNSDEEPIEIREDITESSVYRIASKTVGTSGYKNGGLFIFDNYIYYSTPCDNQNKDGSYATDRTEFFRTKLDGTGTQLLYTSKESTSTLPYAFYKWGDKVYLVLQDGTDLISVTIGNKVEKVTALASDVTGALLPYKDVYYNGIDTNSVEDFIYYTRAYTDEDNVQSGNVLTVMRPDGSEMFELKNGSTITLKGAHNGYLFYQEQTPKATTIRYTNMHDQFTWKDPETQKENSPTYTEAYNQRLAKLNETFGAESALIGEQSGVVFGRDNISSYTDIVCVRPDKRSNQVFALCVSSSGLYIASGTDYYETLYSGSVGSIYAVVGTDVFFNSGNTYYLADRTSSGVELITLAENMNSTATFGLDIVDNLVMMFGEADEYAADYALFFDLDHLDNKQFVGMRNDEDNYDPDVELNPAPEESDQENA